MNRFIHVLCLLTAGLSFGHCQDSIYSNLIPGWTLKEYALAPDVFTIMKDIQMVNDSIGFVVGNNGQIARTLNGGKTWEAINSGTTLHLSSVFFVNANVGFISGQAMNCLDEDCNKGCVLLKTFDGGATFSKTFFEDYISIYSLKFFDNLNGLAIINTPSLPNSRDCFLGRTSDGGINWELLKLDIAPAYNEFYCTDNTLFVPAENQKIYRSTDHGLYWDTINTPVEAWNSIRSIYFYNQDIGFVDGISNIYKTIDGGMNWEPIYFPFETIQDFHFYNDTMGFKIEREYKYGGGEYPEFIGCYSWSTFNGGVTWNKSETFKNLYLINLRLLNSIKGYCCNNLFYYSLERDDQTGFEKCWFYTEVNEKVCLADSLFVGARWEKNEGTYFDILKSREGCDSIIEVTLSHLTVAQGSQDISVCAGDSILIGNKWEKEEGFYFDTITCQYGCDSIVRIYLRLLSCETGCFSEISKLVRIYPNPVNDFLIVELDKSEEYSIDLYSSTGTLLKSLSANDSSVVYLDFTNYVTGLYFLTIYNKNENQTFKIFK